MYTSVARAVSNRCFGSLASLTSAIRRGFSVQEVVLPSLGESVTEGQVQTWIKKKGDYVNEDEVVVAIESDKMGQEIRSTYAGQITEVMFSEGSEVQVGEVLFRVDTSKQGAPVKVAEPVQATQTTATRKTEVAPPTQQKVVTPPPLPPRPVSRGTRTEHREPMTFVRQKVSHYLKESQNIAACLSTFQECDMSAVITMQQDFNTDFEKIHGVPLSFLSFFTVAASKALHEFPMANASIEDNEIVYRDYADIGVTMAAPTGTVTPVVRNASNLSFREVEQRLFQLSQDAQSNALALEDLHGGNFTISNNGAFNGMLGTPMLTAPQSAILGIHNIENRGVVVGDDVEARPMMYLALTYDHRLLDGREAVLFLRKIKLLVEDPIRILLKL